MANDAVLKMRVRVVEGWDLMKVIDAGINAGVSHRDPEQTLNDARQAALNDLAEQGVIVIERDDS